MSLKIICRCPADHIPETIALPTSDRGANARQPGETASRLLRIVPASPENGTICWKDFEILKSLFSPAELLVIISLYLVDMDQHLLQIAHQRARRDFRQVAHETQAVARIAGNLGALHVREAAHRLNEACLAGDTAATYSLLGALSKVCDEAATELNKWLAHHPAQHGA